MYQLQLDKYINAKVFVGKINLILQITKRFDKINGMSNSIKCQLFSKKKFK